MNRRPWREPLTASAMRWSQLFALVLMSCLMAGCGSAKAPSSANTPSKDASPPPVPAPPLPEPPQAAPPLPAPPPPPRAAAEKQDPGKIVYYQPDAVDPQDPQQHTVVKVFYGTDRAAVDVSQWQQAARTGWPWLAIVFGLGGAGLLLGARWGRSRLCFALACILLAGAGLLGAFTLYLRFAPELAERDVERMYGNGRGQLELGTCVVSIPKDHRVGELESPSVLRLEVREDPERHVVLLDVAQQDADPFYEGLRQCVQNAEKKQAFVFVHGYNVGFETAARRTAQIAYDLKFEGAPIFFSWPSQEGLLAYTVDETNVAWAVPDLKEFLLGVARRSGAQSIHLIAHSMGNRALTTALRELAMELRSDCPRFHEVILAAPDIDAEVFRRDLAPALAKTAGRVTLYASSNDEALIASKRVHGYRRAGDTGGDVLVVPGIDTVDVSEVDTSFIGHSYYGSNGTVLADLFEIIHTSKPPDHRKWLRSIERGTLKYWRFLREHLQQEEPPPPQF